ncbi:MAG: response regulator transcription factor [Planctomycetaceae bacterium]|jgi:two-component system response regulator FixJ|nr:response regulator transcription factor [Planctomycetaceae bacterium]
MNSTMTQRELIVYLIDDDESVLNSQRELLTAAGISVQPFRSAESFLAELNSQSAGCVVTDLKLSGMSGLDLQRRLIAINSPLPLIVVSGHANISTTVELMENGAITLLQKPYDANQLLGAVQRGLDQFVESRKIAQEINSIQRRLNSLTDAEMSVLELMIAGRPNKVISTELEISMRTVDRRRSIVLEKMQVDSAPELARLVTLVEATSST